MIEKRNPHQKGQLVKKVESCLQGQATIFQGGGGSSDDSEEDVNEEEVNVGSVRGYKKLADGRVTTFFNNTLDEQV